MRKNVVAGIFALGLIIAGGTGAYMVYAKDNTTNQVEYMQQVMNSGQMSEMMNSTNIQQMQKLMQSKHVSFEDMLPYMQKMNPNLSNEQLKSLYDQMMGQNGSASCRQFMNGFTKNTSDKN